MTATWVDRVKDGGRLTVFLGETVTGQWATVMNEANRDFNALSRIKGLWVTLERATEAPTVSGGGGADVAVAPATNTPRGRRPVEPGVMKVIAVHEFVHACGRSNAEHSTEDLFQGFPQADPGDNAAGDRVRDQPGRNITRVPPLVLSANTVQRIKSVW